MSEQRFLPVNAFIVGTQKAATTSLYYLLVQHRQITRRGPKEYHYFDNFDAQWTPNTSTYGVWTRHRVHKLCMDACPSYLMWPTALTRLRDYAPDAKLVANFRDPVERAWSQWMMRVNSRGTPDYAPFATFVEEGLRPEFLTEPTKGATVYYRTHSLFARGMYGLQLSRALDVFDRDRWLLFEFSALIKDMKGAAAQVTQFYGLSDWTKEPEEEVLMSAPEVRAPAPTAEQVERVVSFYADDLPLFAKLSGLDVSGWSTSKVLSGEMSTAELADKLASKLTL